MINAGLALLILIWGTTWSVIRIGLDGIPPFTGVALRFLLAGVVLLAAARLSGVRPQSSFRLRRLWAIEALFGFVISYGVVYWAEQWVPTGLTAVLFSTFPLFVAVLAHFTLPDERLRPIALVGLVLGIVGVAVIFSEDLTALAGPRVTLGATILLAASVAAAISHVSVKKWGHGIHPVNLAAVPMVLAGLVMGALALTFDRERAMVFDARSVGSIVYLALVGTVITFTLYYWLLARLPATRLSLITYALPVVALTIGVVAFDEPVSSRMVAGAALIIGGVALATREGGSGSRDDLP